jgi:hypothetical protein
MAKKKTARRRRRSGYTVGPAPVRRRKMNGVRRTKSRRRGRIRGISTGVQADAVNVLQMAVGAIGGGMLIGLAERITPNYYVRAGGVAVLGIMLGKFSLKLKPIGLGMATAGVVGVGTKLLNQAGVMPGALNGRRTLSKEKMAALVAEMKRKGLNGRVMTLNGDGRAEYAVKTLNYSGHDSVMS